MGRHPFAEMGILHGTRLLNRGIFVLKGILCPLCGIPTSSTYLRGSDQTLRVCSAALEKIE